MNHTIMVTLVGQEILLGKHTSEGGVTPRDWLHFMISLLCHDIGYVRGVCRGDRKGYYVSNENGDAVAISAGATDASLTPYHVTRSKLFVRERFGKVSLTHIDTREIEANIEHTRFPVPEQEQHASTADYPGLLRAADLIGQLADINYLRKTSALFAEFRETGASENLDTGPRMICGQPTRLSSGRPSAPISAMHSGICRSRRKASSGSPTSMRTCSRQNTVEPLLRHKPGRTCRFGYPQRTFTPSRCPLWVKSGKAQGEHMFSALPRRSQPIDATLYLKGKRWSVGWNGDFIEVLPRQKRRNYGTDGSAGSH